MVSQPMAHFVKSQWNARTLEFSKRGGMRTFATPGEPAVLSPVGGLPPRHSKKGNRVMFSSYSCCAISTVAQPSPNAFSNRIQ